MVFGFPDAIILTVVRGQYTTGSSSLCRFLLIPLSFPVVVSFVLSIMSSDVTSVLALG